MLQPVLITLLFAMEAGAKAIVPELTGPYKVGTTVLELVDHSRKDPFAPTNQPRDLMISLFYPTDTHPKHAKNCTLAPQFPPQTAAALDLMINGTAGQVAESITTRACTDGPLSRPDLPLLFLDHGLGTSRLFHSDMASEFASQGWNVVTVDHPYDSVIVEYPDGRIALASDSTNPNATLEAQLSVRVEDVIFVLDSLADAAVASRIPGLRSSCTSNNTPQTKTKTKTTPLHLHLRTARVGVFGHSFGGAAALQLLHADARFAVGANLDGAVYGSVVREGTASPFAYLRRPDHTETSDPTWAAAWPHLRGFRREYAVAGTLHGAFTDLPVFRDLVGEKALGDYAQGIGAVGGARMLAVETAFLGALFERFLKGAEGELLDGVGLEAWPEVIPRE